MRALRLFWRSLKFLRLALSSKKKSGAARKDAQFNIRGQTKQELRAPYFAFILRLVDITFNRFISKSLSHGQIPEKETSMAALKLIGSLITRQGVFVRVCVCGCVCVCVWLLCIWIYVYDYVYEDFYASEYNVYDYVYMFCRYTCPIYIII